METIAQMKKRLHAMPRVSLGFYPTPLHLLETISREHQVNVYIKREDFSGISLFGGNKVRKLEYLLGDAKKRGCDTVVTYGATQSNHAMETATAARRCGMHPVLFLVSLVAKQEEIRANLLLDTILGAEVHVFSALPGENMDDVFVRCQPQIDARIAQLTKEGRQVYDMPSGGSNEIGILGYTDAFVELIEQFQAMGVHPDAIFTATGTGGTLAGLAAGKAWMGETIDSVDLIGVQVSPKKEAAYKKEICDLANGALHVVGANEKVTPELFSCDGRYYMPGYEIPNPAANDDIRYLARTEGLFSDPVYSGKAFHGMMERIRNGEIPKGSNVVFLHTGGTTALFSEPEIVGDLSRQDIKK